MDLMRTLLAGFWLGVLALTVGLFTQCLPLYVAAFVLALPALTVAAVQVGDHITKDLK